MVDLLRKIDPELFENKHITELGTQEKPLYIAKEIICDVLGYRTTSEVLPKIPKDCLSKQTINKRCMSIISEPGLYWLMAHTKRKEAEKIQDWLSGELIPLMRKIDIKQGSTDIVEQISEKMSQLYADNEKLIADYHRLMEEQKSLNDKIFELNVPEVMECMITNTERLKEYQDSIVEEFEELATIYPKLMSELTIVSYQMQALMDYNNYLQEVVDDVVYLNTTFFECMIDNSIRLERERRERMVKKVVP